MPDFDPASYGEQSDVTKDSFAESTCARAKHDPRHGSNDVQVISFGQPEQLFFLLCAKNISSAQLNTQW
jgi:hypothetical protein